jgi:hypothetical protein
VAAVDRALYTNAGMTKTSPAISARVRQDHRAEHDLFRPVFFRKILTK